jgi:hypothetical protein
MPPRLHFEALAPWPAWPLVARDAPHVITAFIANVDLSRPFFVLLVD